MNIRKGKQYSKGILLFLVFVATWLIIPDMDDSTLSPVMPAKADPGTPYTIDPTYNLEVLGRLEGSYRHYAIFLKFSLAVLDMGGTAENATLKLRQWEAEPIAGCDDDIRMWYVSEQSWDESTTASAMLGYTRTNETNLSGATGQTYQYFNITTPFIESYDNGDGYFTIRIEDPDFLVYDGSGSSADHAYTMHIGSTQSSPDSNRAYDSRTFPEQAYRPQLEVEVELPTYSSFTLITEWDVHSTTSDSNLVSWLKWDTNNVSLGTITSATVRLYNTEWDSGNHDNDIRVWLIEDENWTESSTETYLCAMTRSNETTYDNAGSGQNSWWTMDVTTMFDYNLNSSRRFFSIRIEDPDYLSNNNPGADYVYDEPSTLRIAYQDDGYEMNFRPHEYANGAGQYPYRPQLVVEVNTSYSGAIYTLDYFSRVGADIRTMNGSASEFVTHQNVVFIRWDISGLPTGGTLLRAKMELYHYNIDAGSDGDWTIHRVDNQTWSDASSAEDCWNMAIGDNETKKVGGVGEYVYGTPVDGAAYNYTVTGLVKADYDVANTYTSIRIEDPDNVPTGGASDQYRLGGEEDMMYGLSYNLTDGESRVQWAGHFWDDPPAAYEGHLFVQFKSESPQVDADDITNEPSYLFPNQTYSVYSVVRDTNGRNNLATVRLHLSIDHTTYLVSFEWDNATDVFTQITGTDYTWLNTSACSSSDVPTNGWNLTWTFIPLTGWEEGCIDYGTYAEDSLGDSDSDWNNHNSWYTDRVWVYSMTALWEEQSDILEDGDRIGLSETLNVSGSVYWYNTTQAVDSTTFPITADLYVGGTDVGASYNDTLDTSGDYQFSDYTTPSSEEFDWSIDTKLDESTLPTGIVEAPSFDNGRSPIFLTDQTIISNLPSEYRLTILYEYPTLSDNTEYQTTKFLLNETQGLAYISLMIFEDDCNISITNIPTTWSFATLNPNATITDSISGSGELNITDTYMGSYQLYLGREETWHELFLTAEVPDGLTEKWDTFHWYFNATLATKNPFFTQGGFYYYTIQDNFEQTVKAGNITITTAQGYYVSWASLVESVDGANAHILPLYRVGIRNLDREAYYLEVIRNDVTTWQPLPGEGLSLFRLYGLSSGANYSILVKKVSDQATVTIFTISMKQYAFARTINSAVDLGEGIEVLTYYFNDKDSETIFVTVVTNHGDCLVDVIENGVTKISGESETLERLNYAKATVVGHYNVTVNVYKAEFGSVAIYSSYEVVLEAFYVRSFDKSVSDEYFSIMVDTTWDNATIEVWVRPHPSGTIKTIDGVEENDILQWKLNNDERSASYVTVQCKISGSVNQYAWRNFTYSFLDMREVMNNIKYPSYQGNFERVDESIGDLRLLLLMVGVGVVAVGVVQVSSQTRASFPDPIVDEQRAELNRRTARRAAGIRRSHQNNRRRTN
jgi:hypothetical protein